MKRLSFAFCILFVTACSIFSQPTIAWQRCFGGTASTDFYDENLRVIQTNDGGYILSALTNANNGVIVGNHGGGDLWVAKLDNLGNILWKKCFGGSGLDEGSVASTNDGGCIIYGLTDSNDGDISGNHGGVDFWVVKLSNNGSIQWKKCLGGNQDEEGGNLILTNDGGYILYGSTESNNGDVSGNHGGSDIWIVKLSSNGTLLWQKCYGGTGNEDLSDFFIYNGNNFLQTSDGGYIFSGSTYSNNGDVSGYHGAEDVWVVKITNNGSIQWQKCLGGSGFEYSDNSRILQTSDGSYIVCRYLTNSNDGDVSGNHGSGDAWIIKLASNGSIQWQKCLGGSNEDHFRSLHLLSGGRYLIFMSAGAANGNITCSQGDEDIIAVKLGADGSIQSQRCFGGSDSDEFYFLNPSNDGGLILSGTTYSDDGDVSGYHGNGDIWAVKLDSEGDFQWQRSLGGSEYDAGPIYPTNDGGFIAIGLTLSNDGDIVGFNGVANIWVVKLGGTIATYEPRNIIDFKLCPNPVTEYLRVLLKGEEGDYIFKIYDVFGRLLFQNSSLHPFDEEALNLSTLPQGVHIYMLEREGVLLKSGIIELSGGF